MRSQKSESKRNAPDKLYTAAEALPFPNSSFDYALIVTTICFVNSPERMLSEAHRVLRPDGKLVIGFIDRESEIGRGYLEHQTESVFYSEAVFYSAAEVGDLLRAQGFRVRTWGQTLFRPLAETTDIEPARSGVGDGAFVVVMAERGEFVLDSEWWARK